MRSGVPCSREEPYPEDTEDAQRVQTERYDRKRPLLDRRDACEHGDPELVRERGCDDQPREAHPEVVRCLGWQLPEDLVLYLVVQVRTPQALDLVVECYPNELEQHVVRRESPEAADYRPRDNAHIVRDRQQ